MTACAPSATLPMMQAVAQSISVSEATAVDIEALEKIWLEMMQSHAEHDAGFTLAHDACKRWRAMVLDMFVREDAFSLKAEYQGLPVGFCLGWVAYNPRIYQQSCVGFISEIAVRTWARRRGVGSHLLESARSWFHGRGLTEFQLSTAVWNDGARGFWQQQGGEPLLVRYRFSTERP